MRTHRGDALRFLTERGAEGVPHPGGTLLAHLNRTADLLDTWWAAEALCLAGLCHAVYGTDGFDVSLLDVDSREELTGLIGSDAEELVYLYASCDRRFSYPRVARGLDRFRDRFTGQIFGLGRDRLRALVELTFANELDVATQTSGIGSDAWKSLVGLFDRCEHLVSPAAWAAYQATRAARSARARA